MGKNKSYAPTDFLEALAPHLIPELRPPSELVKFTRNTDIVGAYVEGAVRELVKRYVAPLRVASGGVIDQANIPGDPSLPQIDTIIWTPSSAPGVFQVGDFALVPRSSALGILEIKSSAYNPADLDKRLSPTFVHRVTADALPDERQRLGDIVAGLGVICVRKKGQNRSRIDKMKNASRVVVLFDEDNGQFRVRTKDIYRLVNFLAFVRLRGRLHEGEIKINIDLLR